MQHILMRIHGPFSSWGDIAPGTHRPTRAMPTRSSILGLVASALGIRRVDDERHAVLSASLGVAVRLESAGTIMSDYHTVQMPARERRTVWSTRRDELRNASKVNTLLSTREHVEDAAYTVALWQSLAKQQDLSEIVTALDRPRFPPYLGRRSCPPALPFGAHLVDAPTLRSAFDGAIFPPMDDEVVMRLRRATAEGGLRSLQVEFDQHPNSGYANISKYPRRDEISSRVRWTFAERIVHTAMHPLEAVP